MTTCVKYHGQSTVVKTAHSKPEKEKVKGSPKSLGIILWAPWISLQNFMAIHVIVVEVSDSGSMRWINRLTDRQTLTSLECMPLVCIKTSVERLNWDVGWQANTG